MKRRRRMSEIEAVWRNGFWAGAFCGALVVILLFAVVGVVMMA